MSGEGALELIERHPRFDAEREIARIVLQQTVQTSGAYYRIRGLRRASDSILRKIASETYGTMPGRQLTQRFGKLLGSLRTKGGQSENSL